MNSKTDTHARLVRAAWEQYRAHGFDAVKPTTIAQRCNVSERTYYRHFPHPTDAAFEGVDKLRATLRAALVADAGTSPPLPAVCSAVERVLREASDDQRKHAAWLLSLTETSAVLASRAEREAAELANVLVIVLEQSGYSSMDSALAAHLGVQLCRRALASMRGTVESGLFEHRIHQLIIGLDQLVANKK